MRLSGLVAAAAIAAVAQSPCSPALAGEASGAGSTFAFPILSKWSADYEAETRNHLSYQSIGSNGGIAAIKAAIVDFGVSDAPLKLGELEKLGMGQFPLVIGGVVPVVNIEGVESGQIRFTGPLLADIYLGKVKTWNDPAIQKLNPNLRLPSTAILVVHRSDGSGTTFNWVNYLCNVSPEWKDKVGERPPVDWPVGMGAKGNKSVAAQVNQTPNSIGYVEYAYVRQNQVRYGLVQNKEGQFVRPDAESFQSPAANADWASAKDFYLNMTDAPGLKSYPITATPFIIMYKTPKNAERASVAMEFFKWALEHGQQQAQALDYVPLPPGLVRQIEHYWTIQFPAVKG